MIRLLNGGEPIPGDRYTVVNEHGRVYVEALADITVTGLEIDSDLWATPLREPLRPPIVLGKGDGLTVQWETKDQTDT